MPADAEEEPLMGGHKWQCNRSGLNSKELQKEVTHHLPTHKSIHCKGKSSWCLQAGCCLPVPVCLTAGHMTAAGVMDGNGVSL